MNKTCKDYNVKLCFSCLVDSGIDGCFTAYWRDNMIKAFPTPYICFPPGWKVDMSGNTGFINALQLFFPEYYKRYLTIQLLK